jgi:hypothetical protein
MSRIFEIPFQLDFRPQSVEWAAVEARLLCWATEFGESDRRSFHPAGAMPPRFLDDCAIADLTLPDGFSPLGRSLRAAIPWAHLPAPLAVLCGPPSTKFTADEKNLIYPEIPEKATRASFGFLIGKPEGAPPPDGTAGLGNFIQDKGLAARIADVIGEPNAAPVPRGKIANAHEMREEFLALDGELPGIVAFAEKWGLWDCDSQLNREAVASLYGGRFAPRFFCVLPRVIQDKQTEYRAALRGKPSAWLSGPKANIKTVQRDRKPFFFVEPPDCRSAIEATITLDLLRGAKFDVCKRADCGSLFEFQSDHERLYCSQRCAHLVAVRESRARAKRARTGRSRANRRPKKAGK